MATALAPASDISAADGDRALVAVAQCGDPSAFKHLYQRYSQSVYNLVLRSTRNSQVAEDLCQEIWVKAHRELSKLRDHAAFSAWLYRIAARACIDAARKRSYAPPVVVLPYNSMAPPEIDPEDGAIQSERARLVWEALGVLPSRQHLALFLKEVEGRSYQEIASILETSASAVETLLFRARRGFAKAFRRLENAKLARCQQAQRAMVVLIDGEATSVQKQALNAHVEGCQTCREQLHLMRRASMAYAGLPLAPVPSLLAERVFDAFGLLLSGGGAAGAAGTGSVMGAGGVAKVITLAVVKTKLLAMMLTLTGGLTITALMVTGEPHLPGEDRSESLDSVPSASWQAEVPNRPQALQGPDDAQGDLWSQAATQGGDESFENVATTTTNLATAGERPTNNVAADISLGAGTTADLTVNTGLVTDATVNVTIDPGLAAETTMEAALGTETSANIDASLSANVGADTSTETGLNVDANTGVDADVDLGVGTSGPSLSVDLGLGIGPPYSNGLST